MSSRQSSVAKKTEERRQDLHRAQSELEALGQLIGSKSRHIEHLEGRLNSNLTELISGLDTSKDTDLKVARVDEVHLAGQHWPAPLELQPKTPLPSSSSRVFVNYDQDVQGKIEQV